MRKYSKLIAATIGLTAIVLGPSVMGVVQDEAQFLQGLTAVATAFGVYQVANEK